MKEKITIMLTLISLIGLAFHYNYKTNVMNDNDAEVINNVSEPSGYLENSINDISNSTDVAINDGIVATTSIDKCNKSIDETNKMSFSSAFNYYYSCNDNKTTFSWNNSKFALKLDKEVKGNNQSDGEALVVR
tara:strand:- start:58 stop:456 length:399 start_codon:yes stop_codon:yes gene_type:complete